MLHDIQGQRRLDKISRADGLAETIEQAIKARQLAAPPTNCMWEWVEWVAYTLADEVVFTNDNQRDYMLSYCADAKVAERALTVSKVANQPTLPQQFYHLTTSRYELDEGVVNLGYFGAFYITRGLVEVLQALESLDGSESAPIVLHIFTDDPDAVLERLHTSELRDRVRVCGYVSFLEFLNLATRFDALIVVDASTRHHHPINPYLPSKLSDYLGAGTDIWRVAEPDSPLSRVETAYHSELGDVHGARRVLEALSRRLVQVSV
jgi:hypothetical protein